MRRRDQPDVDVAGAARAHRPHLAVAEEPEEHRLGVRRELGHLVEEHRPAVRLAEEPGPALEGARERPALVAEELAPEELAREGAAVHGLEPGAAAAAQPVERGGDELLAGPGLAEDQHRHVVRGHAPDPVEERRHRRAPADQPLEPRQWLHARPPRAASSRRRTAWAEQGRCQRPASRRKLRVESGGLAGRRQIGATAASRSEPASRAGRPAPACRHS